MVLLAMGIQRTALASDVFDDATLGLGIGDDARFFLELTRARFAVPSPTAAAVVKRCPRPESDFPVVLLIAAAARTSPDKVLQVHARVAAWTDVFADLQVSAGVLFAGLDRDPGPPYGRAWGNYEEHQGKAKKERFVLPDTQVVELAKLQIASAYYRVSPYTIVEARQRGVTVERYAVIKSRPAGVVAASRTKPGHEKPAKSTRPERGEGHAASHKNR